MTNPPDVKPNEPRGADGPAPPPVPPLTAYFAVFWITVFLAVTYVALAVLVVVFDQSVSVEGKVVARDAQQWLSHAGMLGLGYISGGYRQNVTRIG